MKQVFLESSFGHADFKMPLKYSSENVMKGVKKMGLDSLRSGTWVGERDDELPVGRFKLKLQAGMRQPRQCVGIKGAGGGE